ncbi:MAG TPA: HAD family hydrolase [Pirellulaceae bacterium]|nr:HAD family hydrolase [Pirellulaceae bacterium]
MYEPTIAVIFDLFGTLVPPVDRRVYREAVDAVASALDVDAEAVAVLWMEDQSFRRLLMTTGSSTLSQIDRTCERLGLPRPLADRRRAAAVHLDSHRVWMEPWPDSLATLHRLREHNLRLGLISDCSISVPELWAESPFGALFVCALFSCIEGMAKPASGLFTTICRRLGVHGADCVYVGDRLDELQGASAVGMRAVWLSASVANTPDSWPGPRIASPGEVCAFVRAA